MSNLQSSVEAYSYNRATVEQEIKSSESVCVCVCVGGGGNKGSDLGEQSSSYHKNIAMHVEWC